MTSPDDAAARRRALDVTQSFVVQAPAGSGKTELLIQRYLALLAHVDRPERVVAMTFTRKAAAEMLGRILEALRDAGADAAAPTEHRARTLALAREVLAQDAKFSWNLVAHPARLRVMTIDAFCAAIARQAPLATRLGAPPRFEEHAYPLYLRAARAALDAAGHGDAAWRCLLAHLDNDAGRAVALIADLLAKRDQWLKEMVGEDRSAYRAALESVLVAETDGELVAIRNALPADVASRLEAPERYAASNLGGDAEQALLADHLLSCAGAGGLPPPSQSALARWQALAHWLLVKGEARFRKAIDRNGGFPPKGSGAGSVERGERNEAMRALLADLATIQGLAEALDAARHLPPAQYTEGAWALIDALADLLPLVAAHLRLTFDAVGAIDFVEAQIAALAALGSGDAPSELLLRLDYSIDHLLVDEFQDTSFTQIELIKRLTAGWQADDGRTLFAVGDPMQSIYRFREAEVRLFVEAQQRRAIGNVAVLPIVLSRNFRAHDGLVRWVNATFERVLGSANDPWRGIVAFAPAVAAAPAVAGPAVTFDASTGAAAEAQAVVRHAQAALTEENATVAVLVRARTHLDAILPALRAAGVPYSAVDLDALAQRQAILDLVALTHAIAQPADRLALLSALRAPWCGMPLADLLALVTAADTHPSGSLAALIGDVDAAAGVSPEGRECFARLGGILDAAMAARGRTTLSARVRGAWLALCGPATLDDPMDLDAAELYFATLSQHEVAGDVPDWAGFIAALAVLRAAPQAEEAARLQVMTLHRAKGLEFDVVIMPGLARAPNKRDAPLIRWRRRPQGLLLAPMKERGGNADPVYAYLKHLADGEADAELGRLLYVGCTRARRRLHLTAEVSVIERDDGSIEWKKPRSGSALARFGEAAEDLLPAAIAAAGDGTTKASPPMLVRIPRGWAAPQPQTSVPTCAESATTREIVPFDWARETAKHVGTIAHRLFAQIGREGIATWTAERVARLSARIGNELGAAGVAAADVPAATAQVEAAIAGLLADPRGRWLFSPEHTEARSEWALGGIEDGVTVHVVLDRTFVDGSTRYIVDFKTSTHEGADIEAFLDGEVDRYRQQLARYASILRGLDDRPIRIALYYPLLQQWREWTSPT
jgi:ATP-dependent exoDNAse (exonuclease V) beta subunit